jgi:hypothetical protein
MTRTEKLVTAIIVGCLLLGYVIVGSNLKSEPDLVKVK